MIEMKNISAGYGAKKVLHNIELAVSKGSFTGIIGRNGAGKSTLLKVLCGLLKPSQGNININGKEIASFSRNEFSKTVAFMPQNINISFPFTVEEFVLFGRYPYMNIFKIAADKDIQIVNETLAIAGISDFAKRNINELSGGERQRVLIAQTIAQGTDIIVFDEPTSHLDIGSQSDILELLRSLNEKHSKTIIATLHDLNAAGEFCSEIALMQDGLIIRKDIPEKVLNYEDIEKVYKTTVIVKTNPVSGKPYVIPVSRQTINKSSGKKV